MLIPSGQISGAYSYGQASEHPDAFLVTAFSDIKHL